MAFRTEKRADQLAKGDVLDIGGRTWTVVKAKAKGKRVRLAIEGRAGSFVEDVKAKSRYTVVVEALPQGRPTKERAGGNRGRSTAETQTGPLLDARGAMTRWATKEEARDLEPPAEPKRQSPWPQVAEEDWPVVQELGAKLIGVEVEGGKLLVPPVTDATILGHLLTMHGVRYDGATMAEAKAWAKEHDLGGPSTARGVLDTLTLEKAFRLHSDLHKDLTAMPSPHWHQEKAPR